MALSVLFWNVAKNDGCIASLVNLARAEQIDVLLLAETMPDLPRLLLELNHLGQGGYHEVSAGRQVKIRAITRLVKKQFQWKGDTRNQDATVWKVAPRGSRVILLAAAHLPAKVGGVQEADQQLWARWLADDMCTIEDKVKTRATVLVGDLNMNPYDAPVISAGGLFGLSTRYDAAKPDRRHHSTLLRRLYNPMWSLFGDRSGGPPGTYYWDSSVPSNPGWHILDQALFRPELMNAFSDLRIVGHDGTESLLVDERPRKADRSDHLPIFFRLDF